MDTKKIILLLLPLPLQALAQTDTTAFSTGLRPLSQHERALKAEWDALLRKGFDISKGLPDRIACEDVFQYEYLVRLGVASASTPVGRNMNCFAKGCKCGNTYLIQKGLEENIDLDQYYTRGTIFFLFGPSPFPLPPRLPVPYTDWKRLAQRQLKREYKLTILHYPKEWDIPPLKPALARALLNGIAIDSNLMEIDSLVSMYRLDTTGDYQVFVRHSFSTGFNRCITEKFTVRQGKRTVGVVLSRFSPDGILETRREPIVRKPVAYDNDFSQPYKRPKRPLSSTAYYLSASTTVNRKREIVDFDLELYILY